jgi:hypothetical protein
MESDRVAKQVQEQLAKASEELMGEVHRMDAEMLLIPPNIEDEIRVMSEVLNDKSTYAGVKRGSWDTYANTDRAQMRELNEAIGCKHDLVHADPGESRPAQVHRAAQGYFACYRDAVSGAWIPAGMRVYRTRADALEWVRNHHPKASEYGAVAFVPIVQDDEFRRVMGDSARVIPDGRGGE